MVPPSLQSKLPPTYYFSGQAGGQVRPMMKHGGMRWLYRLHFLNMII